jgi:lipoate-protein ligase A
MPIPPLEETILDEARAASALRTLLWEPAAPVVVLGRANEAERECDLDACRDHGIPVVRRRGGGGAVVLAPGMLVISLAAPAPSVDAGRTFRRVNDRIIEGLRSLGIEDLSQRGISDVCLGDRKILGCSLLFARGFFLYQGCLLVAHDPTLITRLLRHPSREPAYRNGRPHDAFLTRLVDAGCVSLPSEIGARLSEGLSTLDPTPVTVFCAETLP